MDGTAKADELTRSRDAKIAPEVLRQSLARPFSFLSSKLVPFMEKQQKEEMELELKLLCERYAQEGRRPSGSETYAVRTRVADKYHDIHVQNGLKVELWQFSERNLNVLRTPGLCPDLGREAGSRAMQEFIRKCEGKYFPEIDPGSPFYLGPRGYCEVEASEVRGPNEYFLVTQPELLIHYGYPFHSSIPTPSSKPHYPREPVQEKVLAINTTFFGAFAGGDKRFGHDVVFYSPEAKFYFYDPIMENYVPTAEAKLRVMLSLAIQRTAAGLIVDQASVILNKFLGEPTLDQIMVKAKTLLAVERGFFEGHSAKRRFVAENQTAQFIASAVGAFIESRIAVDDTQVLTISECVAQLQSFCQQRGESLPSYKEVKVVVQMKMREVHGKGLRNDLLLEDNRCVCGWRGLRIQKPTEIRESGESERSEGSVTVLDASDN